MPTSLLSIILLLLVIYAVERKKGVLYKWFWNPIGFCIIGCLIAWGAGYRAKHLYEAVEFAMMSNFVIIGALFVMVIIAAIGLITWGTVCDLRVAYDAGFKEKIEAKEAEEKRIEEEKIYLENIQVQEAQREFLKNAYKLPFKAAWFVVWPVMNLLGNGKLPWDADD